MLRIILSLFLLAAGLSGFAQTAIPVKGTYLAGHYYDRSGQRVDGLLSHAFTQPVKGAPANYLYFKPTPEAKEQKLTVQEVQAFVIGQDSFTVKRDFSINNHDQLPEDFMRVVKSGPLSYYLHYATANTPRRRNVLTHFVEKEGELYRMAIPKNFNEQIMALVSDNKVILKKVKSKEYQFKDLQLLIDEYNLSKSPSPAKL
ncbi:hypothetical protein [Rufibacter ruber]|uniref:hypothetical protein n=1 Tax=Rufibacter ruber TaxID=1783499 RepID=UPI00082BDC97|nr:hypothetical protein [Rufibacter ruber]